MAVEHTAKRAETEIELKTVKGIPYTKKVRVNSLAYEERFVGKQVSFDDFHVYTVVYLDGPAHMAYLLRVGPLE
jgi:hypothetical protein